MEIFNSEVLGIVSQSCVRYAEKREREWQGKREKENGFFIRALEERELFRVDADIS